MSKVPANTPVYLIKPKYIFKSPFLKYDLQNPTNREAQNEQLTQYFNYGFNEDTMNIYAKLVNRTLKVLDHKKNLEYFDEPSQLMRLNDEIPMDFGGFCKFYDPDMFKNDFIQNDQQLFKVFLFNTFKATYINGKQYPMLEFVKSMYPKTQNSIKQQQNDDQDNPLPAMIDQISLNLQKKYQETMKKLIEQNNQQKEFTQNIQQKKINKIDRKSKVKQQEQSIVQEKSKKQHKKQQSSSQSSSSSSSDSSQDSSSQSSSESEDEKRRRSHKQKKRSRRQSSKRQSSKRDKHRKDRRQRSKERRNRSQRVQSTRHKESRKDSRHHSSKNGNKHESRDKDRKQKKKHQHRSRSRDDYRRKHR